MPTITRKKLVTAVKSAVDVGCGRCTRRPRLFRMLRHKPKFASHKQTSSSSYSSTSSSSYNNKTSSSTDVDYYTSFSDDHETLSKTATPVKGLGRVGGEGVAVEKDSGNPYLDFRHSMLQMILENEIYSKDDLRQLLNCFLQLNAPCDHGVIIGAFTDIWNGVFSVRSTTAGHATTTQHLRLGRRSRDY